MGPVLPLLLAPLMFFLTVDQGLGSSSQPGRVVAAPHDGYDQYSGVIAKDVAQRLRWGWVKATGYRSYPLRRWFDVNRPTERRYRGGGFEDGRVTNRGVEVFHEYRRALRVAARVSANRKIPFLVEIHGHTRQVRAGSGTLRIEAIELATRGYTLAQLRRVKQRYDRLLRDVPQRYRVPLAIDRLNREYEVDGWIVPFYFRATSAKNSGSLQRTEATFALHFELPPRARNTYSARSAYGKLIAELLRTTYADVR
ncbi:MAG: hypothetical protein JKY65_14810 [Planctomycetes bacterium]|nr:hypothetical protein [Planctomycetota bacterium]